jgi:hypothetical protein
VKTTVIKIFLFQKKITPGNKRKKLSSGTNGIKKVPQKYVSYTKKN